MLRDRAILPSTDKREETEHPSLAGYNEAERLLRGGIDIVTGGFPCQDISTAGKGAGIQYDESTGEASTRSGLWGQLARTIRLVRPRFALLENVAALLCRGMGKVLADLAEVGYNTEWDCIPAEAIGAPHERDRAWILAIDSQGAREWGEAGNILSQNGHPIAELSQQSNGTVESSETETSNAWQERIKRFFPETLSRQPEFSWCEDVRRAEDLFNRPDIPEPLIHRNGDGIPSAMDRTSACGNAIIPQIVKIIGEALIKNLRTDLTNPEDEA